MVKKTPALTGRITGGQVVFGTTKNLGDYNSRKVEVTLTFQIEEGADATEIVRATGQEAILHANEMLSGRAMGAVANDAVAPKTTAPATGTAATKELAAASMNAKDKAAKEPQPEAVKATPAEAGEDLGGEVFNEDEVDVDITDDQLSTELNRTVARLKPKHGMKAPMVVKELIQQFVAPPKKSHDIPQQQRQQFVQKLKELV